MDTLKTILRYIGRFLVNIVIPLLVQLGKAIMFISRRFSAWWLATFRAQSSRGKLLFGLVTLAGTALLCSLPQALLSGVATPAPGVVDLEDGIPPAGATQARPVSDNGLGEVTASQLAAGQQVDRATEEPAAPTEAPSPTNTAEPIDTPVPADTATAAPTRTTRPTATAALTTAALTSTATALPTEPPPADTVVASVPAGEEALVTSIIDGDTIEVAINGQSYRVRYIGMDTPESGMPFFSEATEANRQLVEGQTVILVKDVSETDRYGRLLRYVYLTSGVFVNAELVRLGFAQVATYPPDVAHQDEFLALQQVARESSAGLWALPTAGVVVEASPEPTLPPPAPAPAAVVISRLYYDGQVSRVESDEYAEIMNNGGSPVNLAGWRLNAGSPGQDFWFPAFELQPGQSCRVYTNQTHPESCGFSFGSSEALWNNKGDCGYLYDASGAEVSSRCY